MENARRMAENGELCFGTIETYLIWNLTEEKNHKTDATNASRTMLMNLETLEWDDSLLEILAYRWTLYIRALGRGRLIECTKTQYSTIQCNAIQSNGFGHG